MSGISKQKQKYKHYAKKPYGNNRRFVMEPNFRGFLCSCNNREKDCIRESYNILNQFADKLPSTAAAAQPIKPQDEDSIEDSLSQEIASLKKDKLRFQAIESGARNMIFIKTTLEDPVELASKIVEEIFENKSQQTRFLLRLVPVEVTCKAFMEDIVRAFTPLAEKHFKDAPKTFGIVYNHRNNNNLSKDDVIKAVADKVSEMRSDHKVDLKGAEVSIVIEVIKGFAFIGVVPNYLKYKKYNLVAAVSEEQQQDGEKTEEAAESSSTAEPVVSN